VWAFWGLPGGLWQSVTWLGSWGGGGIGVSVGAGWGGAAVGGGGVGVAQLPNESPWARWAGTAEAPIVMVCALSGLPGGT